MAKLPLDGSRHTFNNQNGYISRKFSLGKALDNGLGCLKATYDFAVLGGAVQNGLGLKDADGNLAKLPSGCIVVNGFVHIITLLAGATATIDIELNADNDLLAAEAVASFAANATLQLIPDMATVADYVRTTAERTVSIDINTAALTAGKFDVFLFYVQRS